MKIRNRMLALLLVFTIVLTYMPMLAFAESETADEDQEPIATEEVEEDGDGDSVSGECGTCEWSIDADGVMTISGGLMDDWGEEPPWYEYRKSITEVKVTDYVLLSTCRNMFADCSFLESIDTSQLDTYRVTDMSNMFSGCYNLKSLDVIRLDTRSATDMSDMFNHCSSLTSLNISLFDTSNVTNMSGMFSNCNCITSLDIGNIDTSNVTNMSDMFYGCSALTSLDVSNFDTSKVTTMYAMFYLCGSLTSLDVRNFDTYNVEDMALMFAGCSALTSLDVSNFDTNSVTAMGAMFASCSSLTSLDVSSFDTSGVEDMGVMFSECSSLKTLNISNFDTSNVTDMADMFEKCSSLTSLDVSSFDTSNVLDMCGMFSGCSLLTKLDLHNFDAGNVGDMGGMFSDCTSLITLSVGKEFNAALDTDGYARFPVAMRDREDGTAYAKDEIIPSTEYRTYVYDSTVAPVQTDRFVLGKDNNSFYHLVSNDPSSGFYGVKNRTTGFSNLGALADNYDLGGYAASIIVYKILSKQNWCFGIASTIAMVHEGFLNVSDISSDSAETYFEMTRPCENEKLLETINYYFMLQDYLKNNTGYFATVSAGTITGESLLLPDSVVDIDDFLERVVSAAQKEDLVLGFSGGGGGHAVVIVDCLENSDGSYTLVVFDENSVTQNYKKGRFGRIDIDLDKQRLVYREYNGNVLFATNTTEKYTLNFISASAIAEASKAGIKIAKDKSVIKIPVDKPVTIKDKTGKTIIEVTKGGIKALVPIYNLWSTLGATADEGADSGTGYMSLEIDRIEEVVIESNSDESIEVFLRDSDNAALVSGQFEKSTINMGSEIKMDGSCADYAVGLSSSAKTEEGTPAVITMEGSNITNLDIASDPSAPTFDIDFQNASEDTSASCFEGNEFKDVEVVPGTVHTHTPALVNAVEATCTAKGYTGDTVCSECGDVIETGTEIPALGHKKISVKAVAATCQETGMKAHYECENCGTFLDKKGKVLSAKAAKKLVVKKKKHSYKKKITTDEYLKSKATCTKKATYYYACSMCDLKGKKTYTIGKALGHSYENVLTPATPTKDGSIVKKCTRCGKKAKTTKIYKASKVTIDKKYQTVTYKGDNLETTTVAVKTSKKKAISKDFYDLSFDNNYETGIGTVTITFKGNYSGTKTLTYKITGIPQPEQQEPDLGE